MSEKKDVRIFINSVRYEIDSSIFEDGLSENVFSDTADTKQAEPEKMQIKTRGTFEIKDDGRAEIVYDETELTGMEGSQTVISFDTEKSGTVTMLRTGSVSTTLVFEKGKRHHCMYSTPYMPFEICVRSFEVNNRIADGGTLLIDYVVEIRGARAERTKFSMRIME